MPKWSDDWDWFEEDEDFDPLDYDDFDIDHWIQGCGMIEGDICLDAGTEYCSFRCPFSQLATNNQTEKAPPVEVNSTEDEIPF